MGMSHKLINKLSAYSCLKVAQQNNWEFDKPIGFSKTFKINDFLHLRNQGQC